ncbi:MAG: hypothetical protein JW749_01650 [Sedimentisphaerales bacterium]|nr:hypothetical protein [Sedimentisphaerales bacterium]
MQTLGSAESHNSILNEQIARQIFDILPEDGPLMVIVSKNGDHWPSNSDAFAKLGVSDAFIKDLCVKVDDGQEPIITQVNDCSIVATELTTERTNCGYIILALAHYSPESTLANITLIEILLSQVGLIAHLIEQNNLFYNRQMNQFVAAAASINNDPSFN